MTAALGVGDTSRGIWPKLIFLGVGASYWVTMTPFFDLSNDPALAKPAWWTLALTISIFLALLAYVLRLPMRHIVTQPRLLLCLVFGWLLLTAGLSHDPFNAIRRVVIAITVCISASAFLMLPVNERQFSRLMGSIVMGVVGLCWIGVIFLPRLAIHQPDDFLQPNYPGLWHGIYMQKNEAGAVMVMSSFFAIYIAQTWSRFAGTVLFAACAVFLFKTGSKTSMAMLPGILILAYFVEHWRSLRWLIVVAGVAGLNLVTVGVVAFPAVKALIASTGIDPTYTARSDIWRLALDAISQSPIVGHGFQSFWQTDSLTNSDKGAFNWAVDAVDAHNAYLDSAVTAGIPGLILMIIWLLVMPLRDLSAVDANLNFTPLTRLFTRLWLYGIFLACLESMFLVNSGPAWFTLLIAVFGLRFQARYRLSTAASAEPTHVPAYA